MSERAAVLLAYAVSFVLGLAFLSGLAIIGASDRLLAFALLPALAGGSLSVSAVTVHYAKARRNAATEGDEAHIR